MASSDLLGRDVADILIDSMAKTGLQDDDCLSEPTNPSEFDFVRHSPRPLVIYTRPQLLLLHKSPLVKPPDGMPSLKDWFGDWNEQVASKKESESSANNASNRDRRFRRDAEEGDSPARPSFRSALSQPSQMGNFKHQSLRTGDRDREADKERDKEGLRNLSDKFDRDRLALPSNSTILRNRERDVAPHLTTGTSAKSANGQSTTSTQRRAEAREATRRRAGEASDDWRRGAEPLKSDRDDRSENSKREDRERPRSCARDASKSRRDVSTSRRDIDREDRDRDRRGDRNRDDTRRERDDYVRRDRDLERDGDDDTRRWRDDGKRDERVKERRERERARDGGWDDRFRGERWTNTDEKEGRSKRNGARDRKGDGDEGRERDGRRDREKDKEREKEREKEKEPAWMETYIPTAGSGTGILGGKSADGELDGIQAWKKGMKEKELRESGGDRRTEQAKEGGTAIAAKSVQSSTSQSQGQQLDEIQLFKLMMKQAEEKKKEGQDLSPDPSLSVKVPVTENGIIVGPKAPVPPNGLPTPSQSSESISTAAATIEQSARPPHVPQKSSAAASPNPDVLSTPPEDTRTLLSAMASGLGEAALKPQSPTIDAPRSRLFPPLSSSDMAASINQASDRGVSEHKSNSPAPTQFNPPPGSRLLAFASRGSMSSTTSLQSVKPSSPQISGSSQAFPGASLPSGPGSSHESLSRPSLETELNFGHRTSALHGQQGFSPFEEHSRAAFALEQSQYETGTFGQPLEHIRRTSVASSSDRSQYGIAADLSNPYGDRNDRLTPTSQLNAFEVVQGLNMPGGLNNATAKGSRFAKFFDAKVRDTPNLGPGTGSSPVPGQTLQQKAMSGLRQDPRGIDGMLGPNADSRTIDDIFAMLNSSAQTQRHTQLNQINQLQPSPAIQTPNLHVLQQQQLRQQPFVNQRLDSLPDHRLDDRNFVPDGLVPGLRNAPPARNREPIGPLYAEQLDEQLQYNLQRLAPQQQRPFDQMYGGPAPSAFPPQTGGLRSSNISLHQNQFRGAPSPISSQNPLQTHPQQRLPPGLAHLGGRPPHDAAQFTGSGLALGSNGLPNGLHGNPHSQQHFNNVSVGGLGFGGPPMRVQPPGPHQIPNALGHQNSLGGLGHVNGIDLRGANPNAALLGLGPGANLRSNGPGAAAFGPSQGISGQLPPPHMTLRQQQQQHLQHQMAPQLLAPHLQQQGLHNANSPPATAELMALLMSGSRRE